MISIKGRPGPDGLRFHAKMARVPARVPKAVDRAAKMMADRTCDIIKNTIRQQSFGVAPPTAYWAARKAREGLMDGSLMATGGYARAFHTVKISNGVHAITLKGVSKLSGLSYSLVSKFLENGTRKMVPRPHIRPSMEKARREVAALAGKEVTRELLGR